jgi:hypothetical protein
MGYIKAKEKLHTTADRQGAGRTLESGFLLLPIFFE